MAKKKAQDVRKEIQQLVAGKKTILGAGRTMKALRRGSVAKVFLSSNCPEQTRKSVVYYCSLKKTHCEELAIPEHELGVLCRKPYAISVLSAKKE